MGRKKKVIKLMEYRSRSRRGCTSIKGSSRATRIDDYSSKVMKIGAKKGSVKFSMKEIYTALLEQF